MLYSYMMMQKKKEDDDEEEDTVAGRDHLVGENVAAASIPADRPQRCSCLRILFGRLKRQEHLSPYGSGSSRP